SVIDRVADDRAGHAVAAATAAPQFAGADGDDLDAGLAQQGIGVGVAVVADDHARLQADHVVAVIPLLALGLVGIATGFHHAQLLEAQAFGDHIDEWLFLAAQVDAAG